MRDGLYYRYTEHFQDVYTIVAHKEITEDGNVYTIHFSVYEIMAMIPSKEDEDTIVVWYNKVEGGGELVSDENEAERFLHGHVKWDGCSNWLFDETAEGLMLHFCSKDGAALIGRLLSRCYEITKLLIDRDDEDEYLE